MPNKDVAIRDDWQHLDFLFASSPDQIAVIDRDGIIHYANHAARTFLPGKESVAGAALDQTGLPPAIAALLLARVRETLETGSAQTFRMEIAGDLPRQLMCRMSPVTNPKRAAESVLLNMRDAPTMEQALVDLREGARLAETLNRVGAALAAELDLQKLVQLLTDEATALTGAQFGSFFYNVVDQAGESYMLYTLSGAPRDAFSQFPLPRNSAVFAPTFRGEGVVRSDDITKDPRYGKNSPYHGMPPGHLPVKSYLAVPVISRTGEVHGGLFFGHSEAGVFSEHHERILIAIAAQAAVAIDNARLYQQATDALSRRAAVEKDLQISEERQRFAIEGAGIGTWHWDLASAEMVWSDRCRALLGIGAEQTPCQEIFLEQVWHEDRRRVAEAVEMAAGVPMDIHAEFRVGRTDGSHRWLLCKGRSYGEESDRPIRFEGILQDITDRKRAEAALSAAYTKERTISATLQEALQPALPCDLPGVDVAAFYQPALDEAGIGGDFYDIFSLDKSVYAFVVGDVSGKGLSAAAQVATVRNMLRCVLYLNRSVVQSISALNLVLAEHELLAGFVTVFAGIYDAGSRKLTYVSCGHEPALLRRNTTGQIEELCAAGLPLGASSAFPYEEHEITLGPGDTLVLYTDGLSEAGPDHRQLLGTEGIAQILADADRNLTAENLTLRIVEGVKAFTGEDLNDDACLLVAAVK